MLQLSNRLGKKCHQQELWYYELLHKKSYMVVDDERFANIFTKKLCLMLNCSQQPVCYDYQASLYFEVALKLGLF